MAARVLSCAFWLQRLSLLRWFTFTMAPHVFACAAHRFLLDGISGLRLPDTAVYLRFSLLRTSREAEGYACTSAPEGWGLYPHEDGVTRSTSLAACLEVLTSFQPTGHRPDYVVAGDTPHRNPPEVRSCRGIVNLTADTLIPEILLDIFLLKINDFAERKSSTLPIYRGFSH
jgi:hypothetical protein